uniref:Uncharacterized protein n=1 Tax=Peronospora matthiolae TaxID=2874970 RepID=A0AAV1TT55_9STRA
METARRRRLETNINNMEAILQDARAAWEKEEEAWETTKAAWQEQREALQAEVGALQAKLEASQAKLAATGDGKMKSLFWDAWKSMLENYLAKKEWKFRELESEWERKLEDWKKKEYDLKDGVNVAKSELVEKAIKTY